MTDEIIPEVSLPTALCPNPELWHCYDGNGTEVEVINFLSSLVIMLKPNVIVETGCYRGFCTERLVHGVKQNGFGRVHTCDIRSEMVEATCLRLGGDLPLARVHQCGGLELIASLSVVDFAFLDSGDGDVRTHEMRALLPKLSSEGVIAVHDMGTQHAGMRRPWLQAVEELGLQSFVFSTPRGLGLARKKQVAI